jgi:diadenosine tetraphosphate (Ap4A) HIT family hydrolase
MSKAVEKNGSVFAIGDKYPVTAGHLLVIPIRHTPDWFSMTQGERLDADQLMRVLQATIRAEDKKVEGFNLGSNCGDANGWSRSHSPDSPASGRHS